jgi:ribosomal protein S18 acetylase RimI-like enzyme
VIRPAVVADAAAVGALKVRAWHAAYADFMSPAVLGALDPAREAVDWAGYLADLPATHRLWIAEAGGVVGGFCRTGPADAEPDLGPGAAEVYGLYLEPVLVGTGLGRELFAHAVGDLEERGRAPICVYAYPPNRRAIAFYERAGFVVDGVSRLDEGDGVGVPEVRLVRYRSAGAGR